MEIARAFTLLALFPVAAIAEPCHQGQRPTPPSAIAISWAGEKSGCDSGNGQPCWIGERIALVAVPANYDFAVTCDHENFGWFAEAGHALDHVGGPSVGVYGLTAPYSWDAIGSYNLVLRYYVNGTQNPMATVARLTIGEIPKPPGPRHRSTRH